MSWRKMVQKGSAVRRHVTREITIWARMSLCLISILMLRSLILLCLLVSGVLGKCLTYFMGLVLRFVVNSTPTSSTVSKVRESLLIHLADLGSIMVGWTSSYTKRDLPISHREL